VALYAFEHGFLPKTQPAFISGETINPFFTSMETEKNNYFFKYASFRSTTVFNVIPQVIQTG